MTCQASVAWGAMEWRMPDLPVFICLENIAARHIDPIHENKLQHTKGETECEKGKRAETDREHEGITKEEKGIE